MGTIDVADTMSGGFGQSWVRPVPILRLCIYSDRSGSMVQEDRFGSTIQENKSAVTSEQSKSEYASERGGTDGSAEDTRMVDRSMLRRRETTARSREPCKSPMLQPSRSGRPDPG